MPIAQVIDPDIKKKTPAQLLGIIEKAKELFINNKAAECIKLLDKTARKLDPFPADLYFGFYYFLYHGISNHYIGNYRGAIEDMLNALDIAQQAKVPAFMYICYDNLAAFYSAISEKGKASEYLMKSVKLKENNSDEQDLARNYISLAQLYFGLGNLDAGKKAIVKAKALMRKYKQNNLAAYLHFIYGSQLMNEKKFKDASSQYSLAIKYADISNDTESLIRAYNNKGDSLLNMGKWSDAEKCLRYALKLLKDTKANTDDEWRVSISLALALFERKKYKECRAMVDQIYQAISRTENVLLLHNLEKLCSRLAEVEGDYQAALQHSRKHLDYYRKIYDTDLNRTVVDIQAKYENEKKERELKEAQLQQTESELKALRAQMNPHFIFNALASIRNELLKGNTDGAENYIVRFSQLMRLILDTSRSPVMLLKDNIELLHLYIQIEQQRRQNNFDYVIKTGKGINPLTVLVPGMILQPLAENAIVHGFFNKTDGRGLLQIHFSKKNNRLKITVSDNGIGRNKSERIPKKPHRSHAMAIIRETLQLNWPGRNIEDYFIITDKVDSHGQSAGTTITVFLPLYSPQKNHGKNTGHIN